MREFNLFILYQGLLYLPGISSSYINIVAWTYNSNKPIYFSSDDPNILTPFKIELESLFHIQTSLNAGLQE